MNLGMHIDPYRYYYNKSIVRPTFENIQEYYMEDEDGKEKYTLTYSNSPRRAGYKHFVQREELEELSIEQYESLMKRYADENGFKQLINKNVLYDRGYKRKLQT